MDKSAWTRTVLVPYIQSSVVSRVPKSCTEGIRINLLFWWIWHFGFYHSLHCQLLN